MGHTERSSSSSALDVHLLLSLGVSGVDQRLWQAQVKHESLRTYLQCQAPRVPQFRGVQHCAVGAKLGLGSRFPSFRYGSYRGDPLVEGVCLY